MRGKVLEGQLVYDAEIERTPRKNNSKTRREKRKARQAQVEGTSTFIPSLPPIPEEPMDANGQNLPEVGAAAV